MCSTREARIAKIGAAIDEVAVAAQTAAADAGAAAQTAAADAGAAGPDRAPAPTDAAGRAGITDVAARLADIWAMIAELDPALATRLRSYFPDTE
jgi:hypothetical protein